MYNFDVNWEGDDVRSQQLKLDMYLLIGGPQPLIDGLEDRLENRLVERMTWAM